MRLLVMGGTLFLGRHIVEAALSAGHEVTLFNRGQTNPHLYPAPGERWLDGDSVRAFPGTGGGVVG
jgi:nucleoside-diphosphate-sugar epimerase